MSNFNTMRFKNNSAVLPIIVTSWQKVMFGLERLNDLTVLPMTEVEVSSSVGEWILGSLFYDQDHKEIWEKQKLPIEQRLAKFSSKRYYTTKEHTLIFDDRFELKFENNVIVFQEKLNEENI